MSRVRFTRFIGIALLIAMLLLPSAHDALANGSTQGAAPQSGKTAGSLETTTPYPTNQIIIKYKDPAAQRMMAASAAQADRLSAAAGMKVSYFREMSGDAHVMRLPKHMSYAEVEAIAQRLSALPEVEYAVPDKVVRHTMAPNDPQYSSQWHYKAPAANNYGIDLESAWNITTGSSSVVVAVIDTGITNHVEFTGRTVPGYDFISDSHVANDGDGRDADPSDPGDWIEASDSYCGDGYFYSSSWHGTHTAGTIAANTNNGVGVAGINQNAKILPVRVLGTCGGTDSDIIDGMRWAAGLSVDGVPANANPAKVLSISLGGGGGCTIAEQSAVDEINATGATIVVAAGNSNTYAENFSPANCEGVITVGATDRTGNRAYYSNYGPTVEISAPGGAMAGSGDPNGVLSTLNSGTRGPAADSYAYYQGTSMATPHVSGIVSLMYSVNPSLDSEQVVSILRGTATAFPGGSKCNTDICGGGIANAGRAVRTASLLSAPTTFAYLPVLAKPAFVAPAYRGRVTDNGRNIGGVPLTLYYSTDSGSHYSAWATTTTNADGTYSFPNTPPLGVGKQFGIEYYNDPNSASFNPSRLWYFDCAMVNEANLDFTCDINLHDVGMVSPANNAIISPVNAKFAWTRRTTSTDNYIWFLYDAYYEVPYYISGLGYTSSFTTTFKGLPAHEYYEWWMGVYTPDGYGESPYFRWVGFNSTVYGSDGEGPVLSTRAPFGNGRASYGMLANGTGPDRVEDPLGK